MNNSVYQTKEWEEFKLKTGYSKSFRVNNILVLQREIALGRTMLYSPMVTEGQVESFKLSSFKEAISNIAKENKAIFYRIELDTPQDSRFKIQDSGFIKSFEEMQPENNWLVGLPQSEEEILAGMKQKGRYNIKIAQKNDLGFRFLDPKEGLKVFYSQYTSTGARHKVTFRSKAYFEKLLEIFGQKGYARVCAVYGKINGKETALASAILLCYEDEVQYLFGGSTSEYKNLMAPYLLHWEIMKWAKAEGYQKYNFLGVAPDDNTKHPWAGITRFKQQFGGYQYDIAGCYDLVIKPFEYQLFKLAEKIRR